LCLGTCNGKLTVYVGDYSRFLAFEAYGGADYRLAVLVVGDKAAYFEGALLRYGSQADKYSQHKCQSRFHGI